MKRAILIFMLCSAAAIAVAEPTYVPPAPRLEVPTEPIHIQPIAVPREQPKPIDKRPFLVAGGVLVLAALFVWNRERARKLEEEHGPTPPRERRWRVKQEPDADADDLASAAEREEDKR
ncbi:MAG TPA: hypothetical protein VL463_04525 [Kofleriaceae bacterium]|nr:hypothetical protein [Kofleriaceae bacterium]